MDKELLKIENLHVSVEKKEILKGVSLSVGAGEVHVVMGTNGAGKSTLMNAIMANPLYTVTEGEILFEGEDLLPLATDERAKRGIFMSFQQAYEIPGLTLENFLRGAKSAISDKPVSILKFKRQLEKEMEALKMDKSYAGRYLNVGFSGGEKKKSEILQMKMLEPKLALLDETDSGLDVDAVKIVSEGISSWLNEDRACVIITHHTRLLSAIKPDFVHVLKDGIVYRTGGAELVERISSEGYGWLGKEA